MPMPEKSPGWGYKFVRFKEEGGKFNNPQINIQLGQEGGKGLEIFNQNLKKYEFIKENLDETVFVFALFKCRKFDKRRN